MKRTQSEEQTYKEWIVKVNKEAFKIQNFSVTERQKYNKDLPEMTSEEKLLDEKFKKMRQDEREDSNGFAGNFFLFVGIIAGILFFYGYIPFLPFLILGLGGIGLKFGL